MVKRKDFKIKKLILIACAAMAFTALAAETGDSYLYWMVNDNVNGGITRDGEKYVYSSSSPLTVKVVAYNSSTWRPGLPDNGGTVLNLYSAAGGLTPIAGDSVTIDGMNSSYYAYIASDYRGDAWSYFIELYNDQNQFVGRSSEGLDYTTARSMEYLMGSDMHPGKGLWTVSAFTAKPAPEPNSALLLLIGCAALALRRRKQIAA